MCHVCVVLRATATHASAPARPSRHGTARGHLPIGVSARCPATDRSTSVRSCSVESSEETASGPRSLALAEVGRTCPNFSGLRGSQSRTSRSADSVRPMTTTPDSYSFGKSGRISRRRRSNAWVPVPRISSPASEAAANQARPWLLDRALQGDRDPSRRTFQLGLR